MKIISLRLLCYIMDEERFRYSGKDFDHERVSKYCSPVSGDRLHMR